MFAVCGYSRWAYLPTTYTLENVKSAAARKAVLLFMPGSFVPLVCRCRFTAPYLWGGRSCRRQRGTRCLIFHFTGTVGRPPAKACPLPVESRLTRPPSTWCETASGQECGTTLERYYATRYTCGTAVLAGRRVLAGYYFLPAFSSCRDSTCTLSAFITLSRTTTRRATARARDIAPAWLFLDSQRMPFCLSPPSSLRASASSLQDRHNLRLRPSIWAIMAVADGGRTNGGSIALLAISPPSKHLSLTANVQRVLRSGRRYWRLYQALMRSCCATRQRSWAYDGRTLCCSARCCAARARQALAAACHKHRRWCA